MLGSPGVPEARLWRSKLAPPEKPFGRVEVQSVKISSSMRARCTSRRRLRLQMSVDGHRRIGLCGSYVHSKTGKSRAQLLNILSTQLPGSSIPQRGPWGSDRNAKTRTNKKTLPPASHAAVSVGLSARSSTTASPQTTWMPPFVDQPDQR